MEPFARTDGVVKWAWQRAKNRLGAWLVAIFARPIVSAPEHSYSPSPRSSRPGAVTDGPPE